MLKLVGVAVALHPADPAGDDDRLQDARQQPGVGLRLAEKDARRRGTNVRAVQVQPNAANELGELGFRQA